MTRKSTRMKGSVQRSVVPFIILLLTISPAKSDFFFDWQVSEQQYLPKVDCEISNQNQSKRISRPCTSVEVHDFYANDGKLFSIDENVFGLLTTHNSKIDFYKFDPVKNEIHRQNTRANFEGLVPFSACSSDSIVYVTFADAGLIRAYRLERESFKEKSLETFTLKKYFSKRVNGLPTSVSCLEDKIYVTFKASSQPSLFDSRLNLISSADLNGIYQTAEKFYKLNEQAYVYQDGYSSVGLSNGFSENEDDETSSADCHFYVNSVGVEDISVTKGLNNDIKIQVCDSRDKKVYEYKYLAEDASKKLELLNTYDIKGEPKSAISNKEGYVFVVTVGERKIYAFHPTLCNSRAAYMKHRKL